MDPLKVRGLAFSYHGPLLTDVNLEVQPGTIATILGPSGVGKSSFLRCIVGLENPSAGTISLGRVLNGVPIHLRRIGYMTQEPALFPNLSVDQNVRFGMRYAGIQKADEPRRAREALDMVDLTGTRIAAARVDELSGGQRQRVALARTLAAKPLALLLDEPLSALDRPLRAELASRIRELVVAEQLPAVWVTHDPEEAATGDHTYHLEGGALHDSDDATRERLA